MKKILFILAISFGQVFSYSGITYQHAGRFGDRITAYMHAKWIAYKNNLVLFYQPFDYSDRLVLHDIEAPYNKSIENVLASAVVSCDNPASFNKDGVLYVLPYFPHYPKSHGEVMYPVLIDWTDTRFVELLRKLIAPKIKYVLPTLEKSRFNVAIHIRTGGGFDRMYGDHDPELARLNPPKVGRGYSDIALPINHPRDEYYIKQLTMILNLFKNVPVYVFIFTDDQNPEQFCIKYKQIFSSGNVFFECRKIGNRHNANVLEDFFAMQQFDCIICPNSNYSIAASKLGYNAVTIFPAEAAWEGSCLIMTKIKIEVKLRELQLLADRGLIGASALYRLLMM